jgi:hypothetical protein
MAIVRTIFLLGAALAAFGAQAQSINAGQCIVAGRINADDKWAPRFEGVQLLAPRGRVIGSGGKQALADVQRVRLTKPALLSRCDGDGELARADDQPSIPKEPVPAVGPGVVEVESVAFPKLRTGGELVELRVRVPAERVVSVTR